MNLVPSPQRQSLIFGKTEIDPMWWKSEARKLVSVELPKVLLHIALLFTSRSETYFDGEVENKRGIWDPIMRSSFVHCNDNVQSENEDAPLVGLYHRIDCWSCSTYYQSKNSLRHASRSRYQTVTLYLSIIELLLSSISLLPTYHFSNNQSRSSRTYCRSEKSLKRVPKHPTLKICLQALQKANQLSKMPPARE